MKMVREAHHDDHSTSGVTFSLMALLQERFKHLQKMKELRQQQELLRLFSESEKHVPHPSTKYRNNFDSENYSGSPQPNCQLSLSLWPDSTPTKRADNRAPPNSSKSCFANASRVCMDNSGSDIDTSLRL
ncbi:hypothetical protein CASFOL_028673 [Castilleja foliolosa]|uniref:Uncharacterized protein n=1 Tax=Castilleja foliolosa TaxID=1961234 RepID=A0ABD3CEX1_9LAMI